MSAEANRFQTFFRESRYVTYKNYLYSYLIRKRAIAEQWHNDPPERVLEAGSGLSPVVEDVPWIVYSDLSFLALRHLRASRPNAHFVVADAMRLPFKPGSFTEAVASEVLEHLPDDRAAIDGLSQVLKPGGRLIVTVPHRQAYYAYDDRFVNHYRRYEVEGLSRLMEEAGLKPERVEKVLGPLEKVTALFMVCLFDWLARRNAKRKKNEQRPPRKPNHILLAIFRGINELYAGLLDLEAKFIPRSLAMVLLLTARKRTGGLS